MSRFRLSPRWRDAVIATASRLLAVGGFVLLIGMLPWLSNQSPEYTVLRARYAELEATPEALAAVRAQLGLDRGPWPIFVDWFSGLLHGDAGVSWISGHPVGPGVVDALKVSLSLMGLSMLVGLTIAAALCIPAIVAGVRGRPTAGSGAVATTFTALPEFLLATCLLLVGAVWLGWLPPFGWNGLEYQVLPALALGIPAGGLLGKLISDAITASFSEGWVATWRLAGFGNWMLVPAVLRRALPSVLGQVGLIVVGLTGGAVAVEQIFAIPGIGRLTLGAATAQDIPTLQAGIMVILALAVLVGILVAVIRGALLGPALALHSVPIASVTSVGRRRDLVVPIAAGALLVTISVAGLMRDPYSTGGERLGSPSLAMPFGFDATGRDLLARVGHGTLTTLGVAAAVSACCLIVGLLLGAFPRASVGLVEVANAAPPIIAGLIVVAVLGPGILGAALAVALVSWAPLAAHTSALVIETRAQPHIAILPVLGVGRVRLFVRHILPALIGPVSRHTMLRLPGAALAIAALSFLGLGMMPPTPEWGLVLSEGMPYVERAPWTALAPAGALVLAAVLGVSVGGLAPRRRNREPIHAITEAPEPETVP